MEILDEGIRLKNQNLHRYRRLNAIVTISNRYENINYDQDK